MTSSILDKIVEWDKEIFLSLNSMNAHWMDPFMLIITSHTAWACTAALVIAFMIFQKHKTGLWASLFLTLSVSINFLVNHIVKIMVLRPRPIHEEAFRDIIHAITEHESSYSFFSAHSSNSFCLAIFSALFLRCKYYTFIISLWATIVAYSRIYVGKHYPFDVLCGLLFGTLMGIIGYKLFDKFREKKLEPSI